MTLDYGGATDAELREIRSWYSSGDWPAIEARLIREIVGLRRKLAGVRADASALTVEPRYTEYDPEGL